MPGQQHNSGTTSISYLNDFIMEKCDQNFGALKVLDDDFLHRVEILDDESTNFAR